MQKREARGQVLGGQKRPPKILKYVAPPVLLSLRVFELLNSMKMLEASFSNNEDGCGRFRWVAFSYSQDRIIAIIGISVWQQCQSFCTDVVFFASNVVLQDECLHKKGRGSS